MRTSNPQITPSPAHEEREKKTYAEELGREIIDKTLGEMPSALLVEKFIEWHEPWLALRDTEGEPALALHFENHEPEDAPMIFTFADLFEDNQDIVEDLEGEERAPYLRQMKKALQGVVKMAQEAADKIPASSPQTAPSPVGEEEKDGKPERGDIVVLLTPDNPIFNGCLMVVTEPRIWGCKGFIPTPSEGDGIVHTRAKHAEMLNTGGKVDLA